MIRWESQRQPARFGRLAWPAGLQCSRPAIIRWMTSQRSPSTPMAMRLPMRRNATTCLPSTVESGGSTVRSTKTLMPGARAQGSGPGCAARARQCRPRCREVRASRQDSRADACRAIVSRIFARRPTDAPQGKTQSATYLIHSLCRQVGYALSQLFLRNCDRVVQVYGARPFHSRLLHSTRPATIRREPPKQ